MTETTDGALDLAFLLAFSDCETCGGWGYGRPEGPDGSLLPVRPCPACKARRDKGEYPLD